MNRFNWIAPFYDQLAGLVFGKAIWNAQTHNLKLVSSQAHVLVLGGGTGRWLDELLKNNSTCKIWYVEASSKMLDQARKNLMYSERILFIHGTEKNIPDIQFDVLITHFFLDMFNDDQLTSLVNHLKHFLKEDTLWLVSEFVESKSWHKPFVKTMYLFFTLTNTIDSVSLPKWDLMLRQNSFTCKNSVSFYGDFIQSRVYRMNESQ